jgi:hypothetical protein
MFVPNAHKAKIDIRKLRNYCLNPNHNDGKHKAYLFDSILGMTESHAEELREILLKIIVSNEARLGRKDRFGQRYTVDFLLKWNDKMGMVRSGWIIENNSENPKLTTCYPL